jgi:BNR repeat protein
MRTLLVLATLGSALAADFQHIKVFEESGRFGGWPANHGIWSWGEEILVGFSAAWFQRRSEDRHQMNFSRPEEPRLVRSLDGGVTWKIEAPRSLLPPEQGGEQPVDLKTPMNFTHPGFAMTIRFTNVNKGPSRLWYSEDKGKSWRGPYNFPMFDQQGVAARTDYIISGRRDAFVFLTASKSNGREGRPFIARTIDGGLTWRMRSFIGPEPSGFSIMPAAIRLSKTRMIAMMRVKEFLPGNDQRNWIEAWISDNMGNTWQYLNRPVESTGAGSGNPPSLIRLRDGRLCLTYGYRSAPYGIRARLSKDEGRTWGPEIHLRDDGAAWDLGYTRSVQRPDGKVVTVYYFNDRKDTERFIAATIWQPPD